MKHILTILATVLFFGCSNNTRTSIPNTGNYGQVFDTSNAYDLNRSLLSYDSLLNKEIVIKGHVTEFCKGEGCWLTLEDYNQQAIVVNVKNKSFVLPLNIKGELCFASGAFVREPADSGDLSFQATGIVLQ